MSSDRTQLFIILSVMFFLLLFGIGATALFIRQWRREQHAKPMNDKDNHRTGQSN